MRFWTEAIPRIFHSGKASSELCRSQALSVYETDQLGIRKHNPTSAAAIDATLEGAFDARASCVPIPDDTSSQVTVFRERVVGRAPFVVKRFIRKIMFASTDIPFPETTPTLYPMDRPGLGLAATH